MKGNANMQVTPVNNVSFSAKIMPCRALDAALELAQSGARLGTADGLKKASEFYNSLRTIENDKNIETFFIDANPIKYHPYMRLGNVIKLLECYGTRADDIAKSIIEGVNKLVKERYLPAQVADEAKEVNLSTAFCKWL